MKSLQEALIDLAARISRRKSGFTLTKDGFDGYTLASGSPNTVKVKGGFIVALGLKRDQLESLRDQANALLEES